MDAIRSGAAWLANQLHASASVNVVYRRGSVSHTIKATLAQTLFESAETGGVVEQWQSRDFIFRTADFPYAEPQRGDKVLEMLGNVQTVFELAAPRGLPLFRYGDAFHETIRVHSKRVGPAAALPPGIDGGSAASAGGGTIDGGSATGN